MSAAANRRRILDMLSDGKISVDEADRLLSALDGGGEARARAASRGGGSLRVVVSAPEGDDEGQTVDVRVPIATLRAGLWLPGLLPHAAAEGINRVLSERGMDIDVRKLRGDEADRLIEALREIEIDIASGDHRVLIYVE